MSPAIVYNKETKRNPLNEPVSQKVEHVSLDIICIKCDIRVFCEGHIYINFKITDEQTLATK